jgi:hypothetical protein
MVTPRFPVCGMSALGNPENKFLDLMKRFSGCERINDQKMVLGGQTRDPYPGFSEFTGRWSGAGHSFYKTAIGCEIADNDGNTEKDQCSRDRHKNEESCKIGKDN